MFTDLSALTTALIARMGGHLGQLRRYDDLLSLLRDEVNPRHIDFWEDRFFTWASYGCLEDYSGNDCRSDLEFLDFVQEFEYSAPPDYNIDEVMMEWEY